MGPIPYRLTAFFGREASVSNIDTPSLGSTIRIVSKFWARTLTAIDRTVFIKRFLIASRRRPRRRLVEIWTEK